MNVTGSISGAVTVEDGLLAGHSTGEGTGVITGLTEIRGGAITPRLDGAGTFFLDGSLDFAGGGFHVTLNGVTPGLGYDELIVTGGTSLSDNVPFSLTLGFQPEIGDKFTIVSTDTLTLNGRFNYEGDVLLEGDSFFLAPFHEFTISYAGGDGNDIDLTYLVPEPGSAALLLGGLALLCGRRRRKG